MLFRIFIYDKSIVQSIIRVRKDSSYRRNDTHIVSAFYLSK